ncbi:MAG: sugar phosphate isomerase/epimerase, partial [Clostridia bacterium]|nr:sugar phosphate isomerase/epimerase [Clostridia bacterium]
KYVRHLKQIADDNGIICNQTHSVFPTQVPEIEKYIKRTIECTAELGAEYCIVHTLSMSPVEDNVVYYNELLPFAKECGVKIATENMWAWNNELKHAVPAACSPHDEFLKLLEEVNDDYLVACLDIGHAEMLIKSDTSAVQMIKTLGRHLKALHIHDNDQLHDSHQIPFSMNVDFDAVVKALKEIDYKGYFTLEANAYLDDCTEDNVLDGLRDMQKAAKRLSDMYEAL